MKVKDLKVNDLVGIKVKIPKKFEDVYLNIKGELYIYSYWNQGIWFKRNMEDTQILPLCINPKELLNFVVTK